mmetsp:Transcript_15263/g.27005  ORF Transcript_15263/g.27005 Transcript_15263/m.27005 type:complete len:147 (+) Transcript_15263:39-479(+)
MGVVKSFYGSWRGGTNCEMVLDCSSGRSSIVGVPSCSSCDVAKERINPKYDAAILVLHIQPIPRVTTTAIVLASLLGERYLMLFCNSIAVRLKPCLLNAADSISFRAHRRGLRGSFMLRRVRERRDVKGRMLLRSLSVAAATVSII